MNADKRRWAGRQMVRDYITNSDIPQHRIDECLDRMNRMNRMNRIGRANCILSILFILSIITPTRILYFIANIFPSGHGEYPHPPLFPPAHMLDGGGESVQAVWCARRRAWVGVLLKMHYNIETFFICL